MTTARELHERLVNLDESETIEAKRASEIGTSILETVCAFANEPGLGGGYLLLGVEREDMALFPTYEVVGVKNVDKLINDLASRCRTDFNVPVRLDIHQEQLDGKVVIVVFVPESQPSDKPVYFKSKGLPRGAFRRIGSADQHCTEDDLVVFYDGRVNETYDYSVVPEATLDDLDPDALAEYRKARLDASPDAEELRWTDSDLLVALGCARLVKDSIVPTVAGIVLFGKSIALRRFFPMMRVDYIRVPGREWVPDPEKRFDSIEMRAPLMRVIRRATAAVMDDLPKSFSLPEGELQRQDISTVPQRVVREAIVNAVMHRNYKAHSPVQIIRYSNRLEIINAGFSLKSPEHLGEPGSMARNPKIAAVLHETRFAETKGSGIRVMREMMQQAGLTPPTFESDRGKDQFAARYLFHHFLGPEDLAWLSRFRDLHLSDEEAKLLVWVREVGAVNNSMVRGLNRIDTLTASQQLRRLRDAGLLVQKGKSSATYYEPTDLLLGLDGASKAGALRVDDLNFPPMRPDSPPYAPEAGSGLDPELLEIARPIRETSRTRDEALMERTILRLCESGYITLRDLALYLNRGAPKLRDNYLKGLVERGKLELLHPEKPNHKQQAYRKRQS